MNCPSGIAEILLDILRDGILSIRAVDEIEFASLLADHLHNLPALLKTYSPELLRFYWEVERPSFIARCAEAGIDRTGFEPLWEKLQPLVAAQTQPALIP
jgi:hypothetical protein